MLPLAGNAGHLIINILLDRVDLGRTGLFAHATNKSQVVSPFLSVDNGEKTVLYVSVVSEARFSR